MAVALLSTSKYLNQDIGLGIKFSSNYNGKNVYMVYDKVWIIKTSCIKSLAYKLKYMDYNKIPNILLSNDTNKIQVLYGLTDSGIVKNEFNDYKQVFSYKCSYENLNDENNKELLIETSKSLTSKCAKTWCEMLVGKNDLNEYVNKCLATDTYNDNIYNLYLLHIYKTLDIKGRKLIADIIRKGYINSNMINEINSQLIEVGRT